MIGHSAFRDDVARYLAKADEPPEDGLDEATWRLLCANAAEHFRILAERHEAAIEAGTVDAFWSEIGRGGRPVGMTKPHLVFNPEGWPIERCWSHRHALTLWLEHAMYHGQAARGLVVRKRFRDLEAIAGECGMLFPKHGCVWDQADAIWRFHNGATLKLRHVHSTTDAHEFAAHTHTMLIFDAVQDWQDDYAPLHYLTMTLRSADGVPTRCLTVV